MLDSRDPNSVQNRFPTSASEDDSKARTCKSSPLPFLTAYLLTYITHFNPFLYRCCPLYFQAKNKSKTRPSRLELEESDPAGLHHCDVVCGKPTSCGLHSCPMTCHRGACPPCLQASFEELVCHCGRTTLEPPIPCGTRVVCNFPCRRSGPSCGHPQLPHNCHQTEGCPPCVHLTERLCDCGKNVVKNIPCSRSRVSCGTVCGALLVS